MDKDFEGVNIPDSAEPEDWDDTEFEESSEEPTADDAEQDSDIDDSEDESSENDNDDEDERPRKGQDPKLNKWAAEQRRRTEAAEREAKEIKARLEAIEAKEQRQANQVQEDKYKQVSQQIGRAKAELPAYESHIEKEKIKEGYDPGIAKIIAKQMVMERKEQIRETEIALERSVNADREAQTQRDKASEQFRNRVTSDFEALKAKFGDMVPTIDKMGEIVAQRVLAGESLKAVWIEENLDLITNQQAKVAAKTAKSQAQSKQHLKSEKSGNNSVDTTSVPPEIFTMYRKINKSWTDADIVKHYRAERNAERKKRK
ncbi:MAG: hypothetical protein WC364_10995 [Eubacteriales bacterium]|jgi:Tfp pilus assembly protein FimT